MENCAATAMLPPSCSRATPSLSAESCTAHWDSSLSTSCRSGCVADVFLTMKMESTDGESDEDDRGREAEHPAD
jgi:hypothetical protein